MSLTLLLLLQPRASLLFQNNTASAASYSTFQVSMDAKSSLSAQRMENVMHAATDLPGSQVAQ